MATNAPNPLPPATSSVPQPRPLRREGAIILLSREEQALEDAMLRSDSPEPEVTSLGKRVRANDNDDHDGSDTEPDSEIPTTASQALEPTSSNVTIASLRYAAQKRLRSEQRGELDAFLSDSALGRQARIYVCLLSIENKIETFQSAAPPYQVSEELRTNINNYAVAVLLSVKISAYKGDIPRNHILNILKRYRFDLPVGIEHDLSNWEKITTAVSYSLTQTRAKVKKAIRDSISADGLGGTNIFALSQLIVHGTPCRVTVQLCSRVALMRAIHQECSGSDKYWNLIDARLAHIRRVAGSDQKKINRAFKAILQADREMYGANEDYEISNVIANEWQQRVNDVVSGAVPQA